MEDRNQNTIAFDIVDMHHVPRSSENHTMQFFFFNGHRMRKTIAPESQNTSKIKKILNHRQFLNRTLNYKVHS